MPGEHDSHSVDRPSSELDEPGGHKMQLLGVGDARVVEYFPAPQGVQEEEPVEEEYSPLGQSEQVSSEVAATELLYLPDTQKIQVEDALKEYWPSRQSEQVSSEVAATELLYLPERQRVQLEDPGGEKVPARQIAHEVDPPLDENVPASHSEQVLEELAPVVSENFPAVHSVQS